MNLRHMRLLGPAIALALLVAPVARADIEQLAKHLHKLDPGGKVGGKSIVGTKPKEDLHGIHGKPNYMIALGDEETIHGASVNDQIGAIAKGVELVPSNHGHSYIVAGPDGEILVTGNGHNLITSHAKGATIILESPGDEVIAKGPHDKIVCAKHSSHELIEVAKGEQVSKSCKGHHDTIEPVPKVLSAHSSAPKAHASLETCNQNFPPVDCFEAGDAHTLTGLWTTESVPRESCGQNYHLLNHSFAPPGIRLPRGVEVEGLGAIGIDIPFTTTDSNEIAGGTSDVRATATNWNNNPIGGPATYRVFLHCTSDITRSYTGFEG